MHHDAPNAPMAGWLAKMSPLPFGKLRWQDRYVVLLDSELRFYRDEHVAAPSAILNLRQIRGAVAMAVDQRPHCIRLEPHHDAHIKPCTIACRSLVDLQTWLDVLRQRLDRPRPAAPPPPPSPTPLSLKRPSFSWLRKSKQHHSAPAYHALTHDGCSPRPRPRKAGPALSLSRRRGIVIPPLVIASSPFDESGLCSSPSDTSSCWSLSSGDDLTHPTPLHPPPRVLSDPDSRHHAAGLRSVPSLANLKAGDGDASPSFLLYKERFHLA